MFWLAACTACGGRTATYGSTSEESERPANAFAGAHGGSEIEASADVLPEQPPEEESTPLIVIRTVPTPGPREPEASFRDCSPQGVWRQELTLDNLLVAARDARGTWYAITRHEALRGESTLPGFRDVVWRSEGNTLVPQPSRLVPRSGALELEAVGRGFSLYAALAENATRFVGLRSLALGEEVNRRDPEIAELAALEEVPSTELGELNLAALEYGPGGVYRVSNHRRGEGDERSVDVVVAHPNPPFGYGDIRAFIATSDAGPMETLREARLVRAEQHDTTEFELEYETSTGLALPISLSTAPGADEGDRMRLVDPPPQPVGKASTTALALANLHFECRDPGQGFYVLNPPAMPSGNRQCRARLPLHVEVQSPATEEDALGTLHSHFTGTVTAVDVEAFPSQEQARTPAQATFAQLAAEAGITDATLYQVTIESDAGSTRIEVGTPEPSLAVSEGELLEVNYASRSRDGTWVVSLRDAEGSLQFWASRSFHGQVWQEPTTLELVSGVDWQPSTESCAGFSPCYVDVSQYDLELAVAGRVLSAPFGQVTTDGTWVAMNGFTELPTGQDLCAGNGLRPSEAAVWLAAGE